MMSHRNRSNRFLPNSIKFISSCIKTVSTNVRSASASVSGSISGDCEQHRDQVLWACFDKLVLGPSLIKHVLLLGYSSGFQVLDVEDASNVSELVSKRDDPVTFLQMQPVPMKSKCCEGYRASHPMLLVVAIYSDGSGQMHGGRDGIVKDVGTESHNGSVVNSPTAVRFYSLRFHNYVHVLRFRSTVYMVRCSSQIVAVGLATQIHCFDALTLENKFSVLTYPVSQLGGPGLAGVNIGYGPMAVGPRWLAYASNNPLLSNTGRLSPQSLTPSPGVSPSTSPSGGNFVARYAMESSKQLASGLFNLGDKGYKTMTRYYQDMLPDGSSSPVLLNSSWKVGRSPAYPSETEISGIVVIKDIVSRAIVSQFRAHTSPISALCFDPSGTLLVTASIHGNNINIFRIMPSYSKNGLGALAYDWSCSHAHLYKLHRGLTPAVIHDFCFSNYSQWIAIVSSRGTCHIFTMSPFGGETGLQLQGSHGDSPKLVPALTLPWWYTPFLINGQSFTPNPPPSVTLSVVSRIKNISGWLNAVSNVTSSVSGKIYIPSGAVTATFHNSVLPDSQSSNIDSSALEYLLVYTPSGHVIQHKLTPSTWGDTSQVASKTGNQSQMQDDELHVKAEPVQWWDVCRRTDWPEKEESLVGITFDRQESAVVRINTFEKEVSNNGKKDLVKAYEPFHLYLSNAEVQISSGRLPITQMSKSKVSFYAMSLLGNNEQNTVNDCNSGEIEIEKVPVHEIEIRRKDLLPALDHFQGIHVNWINRVPTGGRCPHSSCKQYGSKDKLSGNIDISYCKAESPDLVLSSDTDQMNPHSLNAEKTECATVTSSLPNLRSSNKDILTFLTEQSVAVVSHVDEDGSTKFVAKEVQPPNSFEISDISNTSSNCSDLSVNILDGGPVHDTLDLEPYFQEGYYKKSDSDGSRELVLLATEVDSISGLCEREKSEEDGDNNMFGGIFAFEQG